MVFGNAMFLLTFEITGNVYTVAGSAPTISQSFADGIGTNSMLSTPQLVAISSSGKLYIADHGSHRVRVFDSTGWINIAV
jgi:hypothetical protein